MIALIAGEHTTSRYGATGAPYRLAARHAARHGTGTPAARRRVGRVSTTVTCDSCGVQAEEKDTLAWTTSVERGRTRSYCVACSRTHLRAIEGKLDREWW